jgi:aminopeptidase N
MTKRLGTCIIGVLCALVVSPVPAQAGDEWLLGPRPYDGLRPMCGAAQLRYKGATDAESLHSYNARHYRLDINLPMNDSAYSAHEAVAIRSDVPNLDSFTMHFCNLICDSVKRNGVPLTFIDTDTTLVITLDAGLPQGASTVIDIWFRRLTGIPERGFFFAQPPRIYHAFAMTCTPPRDCRYWMPCYDEPLDKAEDGVELNLTVPDTFQTCANGVLDSVTENGNGTHTYWWSHDYSIATYLITFSASRFASWQQNLPTGTGDTVPALHFIWPTDSAQSVVAFARLPDIMRFFSDTLRYGAYPFEKYGHTVGYYAFPWGGMENQTLVMINGQWLNGDDIGMAHEMSHMWYGDMVTCVDFRDVWLNEGFGTYSECLFYGHQRGRSSFNTYISGIARTAINQDRSRRFPVYNPPEADIYNYGTIYCKGSWVVRMLQFAVGDTAWDQPGIFFRALRAYADSFRYGTASTEDLERVCEQQLGQELGWFFDDWIYAAGYPKYHLNWQSEPAGDSFRVITTLSQTNGTGGPACYRMPLPVRLNCAGESVFVTLRPQANPQTDTFTVAASPQGLTFDPDNWVLDSSYVTGIAEPGQNPLHGPQVLSVSPSPARRFVRFSLPLGAARTLTVFDNSGRVVERLAAAGEQEVVWRPQLPAGVYFVQAAGEETGPLTRFVLAE